jgi:tetratricopeptide (TPR) repeat protein
MTQGWSWVFIFLTLFRASSELAGQTRSAEIQRRYQLAREALVQHDLQRASQEYAEILKLDPRNAEIYAALGMTLYGMGKPAEAVAALGAALNLDGTQTTAELFLGLSRSDLGQCAEAIPLLRKNFSERTEQKLRRLVGLSMLNCYSSSSELELALDLARTLKRSYPDDPDVLYHLAAVYSQLWNATVAELLKQHPESYRIHQLAGETLEAQGKNDLAMREYRKAVEINPKVPRVRYRIGRLIAAKGRDPAMDQEALSQFRQELAVNPADAASEYEIGEIFRKNHQLEEAQKHFLRALELSPTFVEARVGLAKVYMANHRPEQALKELEQAIRSQPEDAAAHYTLMLVYRDLGRTEESNRELAVFQQLEAKKDRGFKSLLESLLTGKAEPLERPR